MRKRDVMWSGVCGLMMLAAVSACTETASEELVEDVVPLCEFRPANRPGPWNMLQPEWMPSGTQRHQPCVIEEDFEPDGEPDVRYIRSYDDAKNWVHSDWYRLPKQEPYYVFDFEYDEDGVRIGESKRGLGYYGSERYVYDGAGRISEIQVDHGNDGEVDERTTFEYGPGWVRYETDSGPSVQSPANVYHYDERGRLVFIESISPLDGSVNYTRTITWDGCLPVSQVRGSPDGPEHHSRTWTWSEEGHLLTEARDGVEGAPESTLYFSYDDEGRAIEKWVDENGDGEADTRWTFTHCD